MAERQCQNDSCDLLYTTERASQKTGWPFAENREILAYNEREEELHLREKEQRISNRDRLFVVNLANG